MFSRSSCALKKGKSHHYTTGKAWFSGRRKCLAGRSGRQCLTYTYNHIRIMMADFVKNRPKIIHEFDIKLTIIPLHRTRFSFSLMTAKLFTGCNRRNENFPEKNSQIFKVIRLQQNHKHVSNNNKKLIMHQ